MKRFVLIAMLVVFVGNASEFAFGQFVIGHRGASADAPENTLAAFNLAWERGADGVEGDFYLSSDGYIVCIHDKDTKRVAGVKHVVAKTTFAELRKLDVGAWKDEKWRGEKIPTIEEVFATVPVGKKIFVELKVGPEIVEPLQRAIAASNLLPEQIIIICFDQDTIAVCEKLMPQLRSHWLTGYKKKVGGKWKPTAEQVVSTMNRISTDGLGSNAKLDVFDKAFVEHLRSAGEEEFHVWTVNNLNLAKSYQKLGAWSITTDRPGWLRKQLNQAQLQP